MKRTAPDLSSLIRRAHPRCDAWNAEEAVLFEALEQRTFLSGPTGPELLVNATIANAQQTTGPVSIASDGAGNAIFVWESYNQAAALTWGIFGRQFDLTGSPLGGEFNANTGALLDDQRRPSVSRSTDGRSVVAWDGAGVLGLLPSIYVQRFSAAGAAQGAVITVSAGTIAQAKTYASVATDGSGNFVVVWQSTNQDALLTSGVYARVYAADGTALSGEVLVNQTTAGDQVHPIVAIDSQGNIVVAWSGQGVGDASGVFYRVFNMSGVALTGERLVNTVTTAGTQSSPAIAMAPDDSFIVAWNGAGTGDGNGIFAQRISSSFVPIGGEIAVNNEVAGTQAAPAVACDVDGDFLMVWSGQGAADVDGVYAREFRADGTSRGVQVLVNTTTAGVQGMPSAAAAGDNAYLVAWSGAGSGDADGVFARVFVNDAPVVSTSGGSASYTENGSGVVIDPGLVITDNDSPFLVGATISITANYFSAEDQLLFTDQLGIAGSWDPLTGTLTLTGTASLASYQAAIRSVRYVNTSDNPSPLTRTVAFIVDDGSDLSIAANRGVTVAPINDAPVVVTSGGTASYTENGPGVAIDAGLTLSDADSITLVGATIAITGNYVASEDLLLFTSQLGITGSWDGATGILTLSGTASLASYQAALRSVLYVNSSDNPSTLTRTVGFAVNDGTDASGSAPRGITVTAVNDAPLVATSGGAASYLEGGSGVVIDPGLTLSDADSVTLVGASVTITGNYLSTEDELIFIDQLGITGSWDSATGTLTLSGAASLADYQTALRSVLYANSSDNPSTSTRTIRFIVNDGTDFSTAATRQVSITGVNDPPVVTTSGGAALYTENGSGIAVDPGLTVDDTDSTLLAGATVTIIGNYVLSEDLLLFTNQFGITGSWDPVTGTLVLTGSATRATYQAALRSVLYVNSSDDPSVLTRTIRFIVSDGTDLSAAATRGVAITAVNDPPVVTMSGGSASYTENGSGIAVDSGLTIADVDSALVMGATVTVVGNYVGSEDQLLFTDQLGITGSWDSATGTLTLSGAASLADYQTALRSVLYANSSDNPSTSTRSVRFIVSDGTDLSVAATRAVAITAVNDPPVLTTSGGSASYTENGSGIAVDSGLTIADVDSALVMGATVTVVGNYVGSEDQLLFTDQLGITGSWDPATGRLTLSGAASLADYQTALRSVLYANSSDNPSTSTRSIRFIVSDGADLSAAAARGVAITAVNDPPVVTMSGGSASYTENGSGIIIDPGLTLSDADSNTIAGATIAISGNYVSFQDLLLFTDQLGITGSWDSVTGTLTLTGTASLASYQAALRSIRYANSSDNPSTLTRTIGFIVDDGADPSAAASRNVTVIAVNDPPAVVTSGGSASYTENGPGIAVNPGVSLIDPDSGVFTGATIAITGNYLSTEDVLLFTNQLGIIGSWDSTTGTLTLSGSASLASYQIALRSVRYANSSDNPSTLGRTVRFVVVDGADPSPPATGSVAVIAVNDPPAVTVSGGSAAYIENGSGAAIDTGLLISDLDSPVLAGASVSIVGNYQSTEDLLLFTNQLGINGTWDAATGTLTLTGVASMASYEAALRSVRYANSSDNPSTAARIVRFIVNDGTDSSVAVVRSVTVAAVNDPPIVTTSGGLASYTENGTGVAVDPGLALSDTDSASLIGAVVTIAGNHLIAEDILLFTNQLGITGLWNSVTGTLTLAGIASTAAYQAALRSVRYANVSDNPSTLVRTISVMVDDGLAISNAGTRGVTVTALNDAPIVGTSGGSALYIENGSGVAVDPGLVLSDLDSPSMTGATVTIVGNYSSPGDALSFTDQLGIVGVWDSATGTLSLSGPASPANYRAALRSVRYVSSSDNPSTLMRTVRFIVDDGIDLSDSATRTVTIIAVNDPPIVTASSGNALYIENGFGVAVDPGLVIADLDSPTLTGITITIAGGYVPAEDFLAFTDQFGITGSWDSMTGTLVLSGAASLASYQIALRSVLYANSSDDPSTVGRTVRFIANDGADVSPAATRGITIGGVNDLPAVNTSGGTGSFTENGSGVSVDPGLTITDSDSATLSGATVTIAGNYVFGEDQLLFADQIGIAGSWDPLTGTLTLTGTASLVGYQTAIRSVRYVNLSDNPSSLNRTLTFTVDDGAGWGAAASRDIAVTPVNDPPAMVNTATILSYLATSGAAAVDPGLLLLDVDSGLLIGGSIRISGNYQPGRDALAFVSQSGITGQWDSNTGMLTLSGQASLADYQAALRTVAYAGSAGAPGITPLQMTFSVTDGAGSGSGARLVALISIPPPPPPSSNPPPVIIPPVTPPPVEPPAEPPILPPTEPPVIPPVTPPGNSGGTPPVNPPPTPPQTPPQVPPEAPPEAPPATVPPPAVATPPVPLPPGGAGLAPVASFASAPATPFAEPVIPSKRPAGTTIQVIENSRHSAAPSGILAGTSLPTWLTMGIVNTGIPLTAGCVMWLVVNYSVVRHSLFVLPKLDPVDLRCLFLISGRSRPLLK